MTIRGRDIDEYEVVESSDTPPGVGGMSADIVDAHVEGELEKTSGCSSADSDCCDVAATVIKVALWFNSECRPDVLCNYSSNSSNGLPC